MKKMYYFIVTQLVAAFVLVSSLSAQEYVVAGDLSSVKWAGAKVVKGEHVGTINIKEGRVILKDGVPQSGRIVMDMNSIINTDLKGAMKEKLEGHLKSDDFFGVEKFPESEFVLSSAKSGADSKSKVDGSLTIKGITHPLSFDLVAGKEGNNRTLSGRISIDRSLYDVKYGSGKFFDNLGDRAINDIFTLDFVLYLKE